MSEKGGEMDLCRTGIANHVFNGGILLEMSNGIYCLLTSNEEAYNEDDRRQFFRNNKVHQKKD